MAVGLEMWFEGLVVGQPANNHRLLLEGRNEGPSQTLRLKKK